LPFGFLFILKFLWKLLPTQEIYCSNQNWFDLHRSVLYNNFSSYIIFFSFFFLSEFLLLLWSVVSFFFRFERGRIYLTVISVRRSILLPQTVHFGSCRTHFGPRLFFPINKKKGNAMLVFWVKIFILNPPNFSLN